ncbi:UNVERIFIED_CONTAM: hypothetical protein FKN15_008876 [Acipenser sinensis]
MAQLLISVLIGRFVVVILAVIGLSAPALAVPATRSERRHHHRLQHGPCSYTFLLPEVEHCRPTPSLTLSKGPANVILNSFSLENYIQDSVKLEMVEMQRTAAHNQTAAMLEIGTNLLSQTAEQTRKLTDLENYIQDSVKLEMVEMQRTAAHNQTAAMLEIGTNLLSQTAEQTRKLTDVEMQASSTLTALRRRGYT